MLLALTLLLSLPIFAQNIFTAIQENDAPGVKFLLSRGVNINAKDAEGNTPIINAVKNEQPRIVKLILQMNDVDVDFQDKLGNTALILACKSGNAESVCYLLCHFPKIDAKNNMGTTALIAAVNNGNKEIVNTLLLHGARPDITDKQHKTAIDYAQGLNNTEITALLNNTNAASVNETK